MVNLNMLYAMHKVRYDIIHANKVYSEFLLKIDQEMPLPKLVYNKDCLKQPLTSLGF